jgi:hypothetical protein
MRFESTESINLALVAISTLLRDTEQDLAFLADYLLVPLVDAIKRKNDLKTDELIMTALEALLSNVSSGMPRSSFN